MTRILPITSYMGVKYPKTKLEKASAEKNIQKPEYVSFKGIAAVAHPIVSIMAKEVYDKTFDEMSKLTEKNFHLNLLKPTLEYKIKDSDDALYVPNTNTINLNVKHLGKRNCAITSNPDEYFPGKGGTFGIMWNKGKFEKLTPNSRYATLAERKADIAINLAHEFAHARQMQVGLSLPNGKEIIAEEIRKKPNFAQYEIKEIVEELDNDFSFIKNFKPQKNLATRYSLPFYQDGSFKYSAEDILRNLFSYNDTPDKSNYAQIAEIDANIATLEFIEESLSKIVPELSEESKEKFWQEHGSLLMNSLDDFSKNQ